MREIWIKSLNSGQVDINIIYQIFKKLGGKIPENIFKTSFQTVTTWDEGLLGRAIKTVNIELEVNEILNDKGVLIKYI